MASTLSSSKKSGDKTHLRVLHVASHTGVSGGGSVQMARMATGLKARGHEVEVVFSKATWRPGKNRGQGVGAEELEKKGVVCRAFSMQRGLGILPGGARDFRAYLKEKKFDIVHAHKPRALRFALDAVAGKSSDGPIIVAQRGNSFPLDEHTRGQFSDSRVRAVVCVADEVRRLVIEGGVEPQKVVTIYGGVNETEFDWRIGGGEVRREFGIAPDAPTIGLIANYDAKKSHSDFFRCCALLVKQFPDLRVLVVGKGMPPALKDELRELGLEKNVILTGFRRDVPHVLAALDVSVNCSRSGEGLTGALRESLCMKTPVVCTDVGGNCELVRDGETGLLVAPGDIEAFAAAVEKLLRDHALATQLAENGYELVMQDFTETARIAKLEALYRRLLDGENANPQAA